MKPEVTAEMMSFIAYAREHSDESVVRIELEINHDGFDFRETHADPSLLFKQKLKTVNIRGNTIGYSEFES